MKQYTKKEIQDLIIQIQNGEEIPKNFSYIKKEISSVLEGVTWARDCKDTIAMLEQYKHLNAHYEEVSPYYTSFDFENKTFIKLLRLAKKDNSAEDMNDMMELLLLDFTRPNIDFKVLLKEKKNRQENGSKLVFFQNAMRIILNEIMENHIGKEDVQELKKTSPCIASMIEKLVAIKNAYHKEKINYLFLETAALTILTDYQTYQNHYGLLFYAFHNTDQNRQSTIEDSFHGMDTYLKETHKIYQKQNK